MQDSFISLYSLNDLRHLVRRWRRLMGATVVAVFVPAAIVTMMLPPTYESTARLLLDRDSRTPDFAVRSTQPDGAPLIRQVNQKEELTTETERIRSRSVIAPVITQLALTPEKLNHVRDFRRYVRRGYDWVLKTTRTAYNETRYALHLSTRPSAEDIATFEAYALLDDVASRLRVGVVPDANIIEVSFRSSDAFLARVVVNAVVSEHLRQRSGKTPTDAEQFFLSQSRTMAAELRTHEERIDTLEREFSAYAPEEQRRLILTSMYGVEERLKTTHTDIARLAEKGRLLKIQLAAEPETITTSRELARNPAFDAVNAQMVELELGRAKLLEEYQPNSRVLQSIDEQIRVARQLQVDIPKSLSGSTTQAINAVHQSLKSELLAAQNELAALRIQERELQVSVDDYRKQLAALSENELKLKDSRRLVAAQEQAYVMYLKNEEQARVSDEMATSDLRNLRVLDAAPLPLYAISPRPKVYLGVALATSLLMAFGVALLADQSDRSIRNRAQLRQAVDLPLLAEFPRVTIEMVDRADTQDVAPAAADLARHALPAALLLECRVLASAMSANTGAERPFIVALTSITAGAGVTTLSWCLAQYLAEVERETVLLVDAGPPPPDEGTAQPRHPGLGEVLTGAAGAGETVRPTSQDRLFYLGSGNASATDVALEQTRHTFSELRGRFGAVIVDTPPVLSAAFPERTMRAADAAILVMEPYREDLDAVEKATIILRGRTRVLGVVFNKQEH